MPIGKTLIKSHFKLIILKKIKNLQGEKILQKTYQTAIVGGGASGLMSAIELLSGNGALLGEQVVVLEGTDRVGKKLVATGNGQGNLTNQNFGAQFYHGDKQFIEKFVELAQRVDLKSYLNQLGIPLCTLKDGKMYPLSKQASAVLDIMRAYLIHKNCTILTNSKVEDITKTKDYFILKTSGQNILAKTVILATGGKSAKQFGTDGTSYNLALKFNHKLTKLYPSLVQLKTPLDDIRGLKGIKEVAKVTAYAGEKQLAQSTGDLLFTDFGVSGSSIFNLSAYLEDRQDQYINVEFLPHLTQSEVEDIIEQRLKLNFIDKQEVLCGIVNKKVGQAVLKSLKNHTAKEIAKALKNFKLKITGNLGFNYSQVTKGGIDTKDVDCATYESKLQKGLYLVGETLNVDGDCGGYNVTFAFVSAIICARDIKSKQS